MLVATRTGNGYSGEPSASTSQAWHASVAHGGVGPRVGAVGCVDLESLLVDSANRVDLRPTAESTPTKPKAGDAQLASPAPAYNGKAKDKGAADALRGPVARNKVVRTCANEASTEEKKLEKALKMAAWV